LKFLLENIRKERNALLDEADILINKTLDNDQDLTALKSYRIALRNMTEIYKADMSLLDQEVVWPLKP
jgi:hypothetical protein